MDRFLILVTGVKKDQQFETLLRNNDFYPQIVDGRVLNYIYDEKINAMRQSTKQKNTANTQAVIKCIKDIFKHMIESQDADQLFKGNQSFIIGKCTQDQKYLKKSFEFYQKAAEQGNMSAQNNLGYCYQSGLGVDKNLSEAFRWYQKASDQGDPFAHNNLGCCYRSGLEEGHQFRIEKNLQIANTYYELASRKGNPNACYNLAVSFDKSNINLALPFYHNAANQGNPYAQYKLYLIYRNGLGTEENLQQAFEWCRKLAEQGFPQAQENLSLMYRNGLGTARDIKQAFIWCHKAAEQGDPQFQYSLSLMYGNGEGVEKNDELSFKWCHKAAQQGESSAQYFLSVMYEKGMGVKRDDKLSFKWCHKAAEQGKSAAQYILSVMYEKGKGTKKNYKLSFQWCHKAAQQGESAAEYFLSLMYRNGQGIERDLKQAFIWCLKSAEQGFPNAREDLSSLYTNGMGIEKDSNLAYEWFLYDLATSYESSQTNLNLAIEHYELCIENKYETSNISKNFLAEKGLARCLSKQGAKIKAFKLYKELAEKNDTEAMKQLIVCYKNGIGTRKNIQAAKELQTKINESSKEINPEESESMYQQLLKESPTKKPKNKKKRKKKKSKKVPSNSTKSQNEASKPISVLTEKNEIPLVQENSLHSLVSEIYKTSTYPVAHRVTKRWATKDILILKKLEDRDCQGQIIKRYENLNPENMLQQRAHHYLPELERIIKCKNTKKIYATKIPHSDSYQIQVEFNYGQPNIPNKKGVIAFGIDKNTNTLYHRCFKCANLPLILPTIDTHDQIQSSDDASEEDSWQNVSKINFEIFENGELKVTFTGEDHSLIVYPQNKEYFDRLNTRQI